MSHRYCEICGAGVINTPRGQITGCEHYPAEPAPAGSCFVCPVTRQKNCEPCGLECATCPAGKTQEGKP